ncbi:MAG: SAM hydrolase/SAM-dependent halogenase family protein [Putridiphycobacter sp.]
MQIVTLTTDLGLKDHYVGTIKGQLLSKKSDIHIVDISHNIEPFNIAEATFMVNNIIDNFPKGSIHFIGVDSVPDISIDSHKTNKYPMVMKLHDQFFVGNDNGIFALLNDFHKAEQIVRLDFSSKNGFRHPFKHIYAPAIAQILQGESLENLGDIIEVSEINRAITTQALISENIIKGSVIHVDNYGNVIVNVKESLFSKIGKGNPFTIYFRSKNYFIDRISENYNGVPVGEKLALFNDNGWLEIAINKGTKHTGGGASSLLGLKRNDIVRIEFHPRGSKDRIDDLFS